MVKILITWLAFFCVTNAMSQQQVKVKKKDYKRDVFFHTTKGDITVRLSPLTPMHQQNFIRLVKSHYYDSTIFHRVINRFMIQGGDPDSKHAPAGKALGNGGPSYTIPAEFNEALFHKKGVLAAARDNNPQKASSGSQFYIVQGKPFTEEELNRFEAGRTWKYTPQQKEVYKTIGGTPHLDQNYTVFGEVVKGLDVVDSIAIVTTSKGADRDRPLEDVIILKAKLVKRKK